MSLDNIKPAELAMLRYSIKYADNLNSDQLDKLHIIEQSARNGSVDEVYNDLAEIYETLRNIKQ